MQKCVVILFVCLCIVGCSQKEKEKETGVKKLYIVTTTGMIGDAVENITGDKATVVSLMGPGVDPHLYKATQGDLVELRKADIIIYNGLHLEGKMVEIFEELAKEKNVFAVADGIDKSKFRDVAQVAGTTTHDPHIWFDVLLWSEGVKYIGDKISETDSANSETFKNNTAAYMIKLKVLDAEVREKINTIPQENRILVTSHDAFGYFGRAYGVTVRGLQGISTAAEFGLRDITDMVDIIIQDKVQAAFIESSVSEKSIRAVINGCKEKGHDVKLGGTLYSDAMGAKNTPDGNYIGMVTHNVNVIVEALK
ncbi:MAG: zinc ABC transporter substrate-binding protein [Chitinophagales bacterium]|nr:zinc ABC transporter substrate-binding protein [Chitinophagales bacterium]